MLINTIRKTACFCLIKANRAAFGMRKAIDTITKAVFSDDFTKIALNQGGVETRYPFIYDRKDTKSENNLQALATTLQYISTLSRRRQSHIVDFSTYQIILKQYYETLQSTLKSHLNWHIDPSYELSYLLPSFIHTDNDQILSLVKLKQLEVFELVSRSREISLQEFMKIFSKDVYNVTDLPLLDSLLHEHFYPRIGQIQSIYQLEQVLQYLGRLESINAIALCKTIKLLKAEMEKEISKPHVSLDWYISFAGCISSIKFIDLKSITEQSHNKFHQILAKLTEKTFNINGQIFQVASLGNQENMQKIISHAQTIIIKKLEGYKEEEINKMSKETKIVMPKSVEQEMFEQWHFLGALNKEIVNKAIKLQLIPKITKTLLAICCLKPYPNQQVQNFLKSSLFQNFIVKYPCYPNLFKNLIHTLEYLKAQYNITITINALDAKIEVFRARMNEFLNLIIKQSPDNQILQNFNHPKPKVDAGSKDQFLWNLEGSALLTRLMTVDQGFTFSSVLSMLKEDTTFLQSRMKLSHKKFIKALFNRSIKTFKIEIDYWNYPHCYTFANADNNFYGYVQHRFNQHTRVPNKCTVYTLTELDQIESKILQFQNKQ